MIPCTRRLQKSEDGENTNDCKCRWCGNTYASQEILKRHDAVCPDGRRRNRLGCRVPGCKKYYDDERQRESHEQNCTVYACETTNCTFIGRDKQDADRHKEICTRVLKCACGERFKNAEQDEETQQWKARRTREGKRVYPAKKELKQHQKACAVVYDIRRKQREQRQLSGTSIAREHSNTDEESLDDERMEWGEWTDEGDMEEDLDNEYARRMGFALDEEEARAQNNTQKRNEEEERRRKFALESRTRPPPTPMQKARYAMEHENDNRACNEDDKVSGSEDEDKGKHRRQLQLNDMGWTSSPKVAKETPRPSHGPGDHPPKNVDPITDDNITCNHNSRNDTPNHTKNNEHTRSQTDKGGHRPRHTGPRKRRRPSPNTNPNADPTPARTDKHGNVHEQHTEKETEGCKHTTTQEKAPKHRKRVDRRGTSASTATVLRMDGGDSGMIEIQEKHMEALLTNGTEVHDVTLHALCRIRHGEGRGKTMIIQRYFMTAATWNLSVKRWVRKLGPQVLRRITPESRLLIILQTGNHFSVIDLNLAERTVQHHDNMGLHSDDEHWVRRVEALGEELLQRCGRNREEAEIRAKRPDRRLHTQPTWGGTNTCAIHAFHYIERIMVTGKPTPLSDEEAVESRRALAEIIWGEAERRNVRAVH